jgi:hypothetical protein
VNDRQAPSEYATALQRAIAHLPTMGLFGLALRARIEWSDVGPLLDSPRLMYALENEFGSRRDDWYEESSHPEQCQRMMAAMRDASFAHRYHGGYWGN